MLRRRYASCSSFLVLAGSGSVGSRESRSSAVVRSIAGCILSLLISNHAFCCFGASIALDFAVFPTSSKKVV